MPSEGPGPYIRAQYDLIPEGLIPEDYVKALNAAERKGYAEWKAAHPEEYQRMADEIMREPRVRADSMSRENAVLRGTVMEMTQKVNRLSDVEAALAVALARAVKAEKENVRLLGRLEKVRVKSGVVIHADDDDYGCGCAMHAAEECVEVIVADKMALSVRIYDLETALQALKDHVIIRAVTDLECLFYRDDVHQFDGRIQEIQDYLEESIRPKGGRPKP